MYLPPPLFVSEDGSRIPPPTTDVSDARELGLALKDSTSQYYTPIPLHLPVLRCLLTMTGSTLKGLLVAGLGGVILLYKGKHLSNFRVSFVPV